MNIFWWLVLLFIAPTVLGAGAVLALIVAELAYNALDDFERWRNRRRDRKAKAREATP